MNTRSGVRWWLALVVVAALAARGAVRGEGAEGAEGDEDGLPDAGLHEQDDDDSSDELALHQEESRNVRPRAYNAAAFNALPAGFRPTASLAELAGYQRPQAPPHQHAPLFAEPPPQHQHQQQSQQQLQQLQHHQQPRQQQRKPTPAQLQQRDEEAELEEEEREEPDRLATLLQQSKFQCTGKQSGYYADTELACEVFHYCQDSVKHSWICPDGFTFHQVHLICMPPTQENICQKSAKYHFVNDYLYRPVNEEEVQRKPSLPLKYSDRYYPQEVYHDDRYDGDDDEEEGPRRAPATPTARPPSPAPAPHVFRSAEEVNIPLGQRRPQRPYDFDF